MNFNRDVYDDYFTDLYSNNYKKVVKSLLKYVHDFSLAEDLAHDIFAKFYEKKIRINGDEAMARRYIFKSAKHIAIDYLRTKKREERNLARTIPLLDIDDNLFMSKLEDYYIEGELISNVADILQEFPERSRNIFLKIVLYDKKTKSLAREENISGYYINKTFSMVMDVIRDRLRYNDD